MLEQVVFHTKEVSAESCQSMSLPLAHGEPQLDNCRQPMKTQPYFRESSASRAAFFAAAALMCFTTSTAWSTPHRADTTRAPIHGRMLGGDFSPIYQGPYAFILMQNATGGARCSGVLVGSREVLTAAHCVVSGSGKNQFVAPDYTVVVGGETFSVTQTDFNPSYDPDAVVNDASSRFDLGVLTLNRDATGTAPLPVLRGAPINQGDTQTLFAFGTNENSTTGQNTLQSLLDQGKSGTLTISSASGGVLHSKHSNSIVISCAGDSGGPLVRLASTSKRAVVGLVSAGTTGNSSNGVCTKSGNNDLSIFVDIQSATSRNFLSQFSRIQYLTPAFVKFKAGVDDAIAALKKVQRSRSLPAIRRQATTTMNSLNRLRPSADTTRRPTLLSAIAAVKAARSSGKLGNAQKAVKQSVALLQGLSALGVD